MSEREVPDLTGFGETLVMFMERKGKDVAVLVATLNEQGYGTDEQEVRETMRGERPVTPELPTFLLFALDLDEEDDRILVHAVCNGQGNTRRTIEDAIRRLEGPAAARRFIAAKEDALKRSEFG